VGPVTFKTIMETRFMKMGQCIQCTKDTADRDKIQKYLDDYYKETGEAGWWGGCYYTFEFVWWLIKHKEKK